MVKHVVRNVLRTNGRNIIMLREDRLQQLENKSILRSQQSRSPGLEMFVTSDDSMWLDPFYDDIARSVLRDPRIQQAVCRSLEKSREFRATTQEFDQLVGSWKAGESSTFLYTKVWVSGEEALLFARSVEDHAKFASKLWGIGTSDVYVSIILPSGVAKISKVPVPEELGSGLSKTHCFDIFGICGNIAEEDILAVPLSHLKQL